MKQQKPHEAGRESEQTARLDEYKQKAAETIRLAEADGGFDKPKSKLFLEVGASTHSGLSLEERFNILQEGATIVTVDAPVELGKGRGDNGLTVGGESWPVYDPESWGLRVEYDDDVIDKLYRGKSAYNAIEIWESYIGEKREIDSSEEVYRSPESVEYRHISLCADGRDMPFFGDGLFGTVIMRNVVSDISIPRESIESLINEALRVGEKILIVNDRTPWVAYWRLHYANLDNAGIKVMYEQPEVERKWNTNVLDPFSLYRDAPHGEMVYVITKAGHGEGKPLRIPKLHEVDHKQKVLYKKAQDESEKLRIEHEQEMLQDTCEAELFSHYLKKRKKKHS